MTAKPQQYSADLACPVCGSTRRNQRIETREMMFGTREPFAYGICAQCGTWWLLDPPEDMSRFYPPEYYSFSSPRVRRSQGLKHALSRPVLWMYLRGPNGVRVAIDALRDVPPEVRCLSSCGIHPGSSLCDVGTGAGKYLVKLHRFGFSDLTGVDKFIETDRDLGYGIRVRRGEARDIDRQFDVVTSHHSFEHAADPRAELAALAHLAKPGGAIVLRTPNADSRVCREYMEHWFELDPPRHLVVLTPAAMELLADETGLTVESIAWDSTPDSILVSEQYRNDIPFNSDDGESLAHRKSSPERSDAARRATRYNEQGEGDRMCVILRKP